MTADVSGLRTQGAKAIPLSAAQSWNNCPVEASETRIVFSTDPAAWSYAVLIPLPFKGRAISSARISCTVRRGSIGIAFADKDLQFVSHEVNAIGDTEIIVPSARSTATWVVFRNTNQDGDSEAVITGVSVETKSRVETAAENLGYIKPKLGKPDGVSLLGDQISILGDSARTIFDVGTHVGDTTKEYLERFPSARVFGFEADTSNFYAAEKLLQQSTRSKMFRSSPRCKLFNVAIGDRDAAATFHHSVHSGAHSLLPIGANDYRSGDAHEVGTSTVQMRSLDSLASELSLDGVDILKMDIQGGELGALKGAIKLLSRGAIKLIALEVLFAPLYHGQPQFWDIGRFLETFGYSFFRIYDQQHHVSNNNVVRFADAVFLSPELTRI